MTFIEKMKSQAKKNLKTIIVPESEDERVLIASANAIYEGYADILFVGEKEETLKFAKEIEKKISEKLLSQTSKKLAEEIGSKSQQNQSISKILEKAKFISTGDLEIKAILEEGLYDLRKNKGLTREDVNILLEDNMYFAMMLLKLGYGDGLVAGATHSTADTLRPALQIIKTKPNIDLVSTFSVMCVPNCKYGASLEENNAGLFFFSDTGLNRDPSAEELADIAISTNDSFKELIGKTPKVAMLSFATHGSAESPSSLKVRKATEILHAKRPDIIADGEIQLDAAIIPDVSESKICKLNLEENETQNNNKNILKGEANVLIFPNLDSANIGYKLVQRLAKAESYGPLCQGIAKPVNDLSRGCKIQDIEGAIAITAIQANNNSK